MSGTGVSPVDHAQDARATFNLTVKDEGLRMKQILLIVAAVLMTSTADAQTATSLHGHGTDPRNANVARARVVMIERSGGRTLAVTGDNGGFAFNDIAAGGYVLGVRASGFRALHSKAIQAARALARIN